MSTTGLRNEIALRAGELAAARSPYVHARVVLAERPTSAKPGDEALILADGTIEGFVGGSCAESTVRAQSLALLDSHESLLLRITPSPEAQVPGKLTVHNPCLSGGTLEIFLEPMVPAPLVVVVGESPIARAMIALGASLGYEVVSSSDRHGDGTEADDVPAALVVATHGRQEEEMIASALRAGVAYVGLVASRKRGEAVLNAIDVCGSMKSRVRTPAGLDIGARTPQEIALSILAEIVATRPRPSGRSLPLDGDDSVALSTQATPTASIAQAIDPVCGMSVVMVDASLHLDHDEARVWFCGSGCLRAFAANPDAYAR
jgi:xanthine dehydrogenase accessory factor